MNLVQRIARGQLAAAVSPGLDGVTLTARFGHDARDPRVRALAEIPQAVVVGLEARLREAETEVLHERLALVKEEHRGFAYEGATMAATIMDAVPAPAKGLTAAVMSGPGEPHLLLNYIGIGFAMARLPRRAWPGAVPSTLDSPYHPTMSWLAVDGYGFDLAYFRPERHLRDQRRPAPYPWSEGQGWYFLKAVDQGVGRALWFAHAARVRQVARAVEAFAPERHEDLWSGVGLAATFAGQADDVAGLADAAGKFAPDAGVGAVLAAKARHAAGMVPDHAAEALRSLTGLDVDAAVRLVDRTEPTGHDDRLVPRYAVWRDRLRAHLAAATGVAPALAPRPATRE